MGFMDAIQEQEQGSKVNVPQPISMKIPEQKQDLFESLETSSGKRGYNIGLYGISGTGKTHFGLTAPEPIIIFDTETGASLLAPNFKGKDIKVVNLFNENSVKSWEKYVQAVDAVIKLAEEGKVKTIIVDSMTDVWEFCQDYAKETIWKIKSTARLNQQWDWGTINKLYKQQLLKLINTKANVIFTSRASEDYMSAGHPSGTYSPRWQKDTSYQLDYVMEMKFNKQQQTFIGIFNKSRTKGQELIGKQVDNINWDKLVESISL